MHTVAGPMFGWRKFHRLVKHGLEGHEGSLMLMGYALGRSAIRVEIGKPLFWG